MGDFEAGTLVLVESTVKYHPFYIAYLTVLVKSWNRTMSGGRFDWGGRLQNCNGGARRFPQHDWKPCVERKGKRELDCETDKSNRYESRS